MRINSRAWPYRFDEVPWTEIAARFRETAAAHPEFRHLADIVATAFWPAKASTG
ncbi:hypothetical protein [Amycolatopsis sp. cg13]|uniref:hypothetical protein n=1 Tax=Amycolatopsis sp. cg13 TaxID=3238807 RepID=UPI003524A8C7